MPVIPDSLGGPNGWLGLSAALILVVAFFWKPARWAWQTLQKFVQVIEDWNGTPERKDHSGMVIEPAKPGVPALLEAVRAQVQNSHSTNLRDDVDASIAETRRLGAEAKQIAAEVRDLAKKLDDHIKIAIKSDAAQDQTAEKVDRLVEDVGKLKDKYAPNK